MNATGIPTTSANIDNVEQRIQGLLQNGGSVDQYNALLQEAAGYAGQHSDTRHNDVLLQLFQGLTAASTGQNGGSLPANFADNTAITYLKAAKIDIASAEAVPVAKNIKALISQTQNKERTVA